MDVAPSAVAAEHLARGSVQEAIAESRLDLDRAIQLHGGAGVSDDTPLAEMWAGMRTLRIADGPDPVHLRSVARQELRRHRLQDGPVRVPAQAGRTRIEESA